jgi:thioredoxin 2
MHSLIAQCPACGAKNNIPLAKQHLSPRCGRCKLPLALHGQALPVPLSDSNFAPFIGGAPLPLVVDFYSPSCGPCRMLAPVLDRLAGRFWGRAIIAKLDTSRNPASAGRHQIRGVPTLLFFKNSQPVDQIVGAIPEPQLIQRVEALCG